MQQSILRREMGDESKNSWQPTIQGQKLGQQNQKGRAPLSKNILNWSWAGITCSLERYFVAW